MENKNFEKKELPLHPTQLQDGYALGYNTCLDRTNAKGGLEAQIHALDALELADRLITGYVPALSEEHLKIKNAIKKLQTELKKSEYGVDM